MKKTFSLLIFLLFFLMLNGCEDTDVPSEPIETIPTVIIPDTTAPQISGIDNVTITVGDPFDPASGVTALDDIDGNLTNSISISGTFDVNVPGVYVITYNVTDQSGNQTTLTRTLTVKLKAIDAAILNFDTALSYTMSILFESGDESYVMLVEIDETAMRVEVLEEVVFYEINNQVCYFYDLNQLVWQKTTVECSEKGTNELLFLTNFSSDYFVEQIIDSITSYVLKTEYYSSLQLFLGSTITSNFRMTLIGEQINQISFVMTRNSILFDMTIRLSKFNNTSVTLPEVTVS